MFDKKDGVLSRNMTIKANYMSMKEHFFFELGILDQSCRFCDCVLAGRIRVLALFFSFFRRALRLPRASHAIFQPGVHLAGVCEDTVLMRGFSGFLRSVL